MLKGTYEPKHDENLMKNEGDVEAARAYFLEKRPNNLNFLLEKRYSWMNRFISKNSKAIELDSGAGFAKEFIKDKGLLLTDVQ